MQCFTCHVPLQITERQGVEIDYCPQCRGVWLDRGELDKLIERSAAVEQDRDRPRERDYEPGRPYRDDDGDDRQYKRKRKGLLGELFDF